jgi:hypothetical protein
LLLNHNSLTGRLSESFNSLNMPKITNLRLDNNLLQGKEMNCVIYFLRFTSTCFLLSRHLAI